MDIDELDELVDYEEDAMMTDAVGDAGEEVDMDPIEEENQNDDEEMAAEADNVPEGTTGEPAECESHSTSAELSSSLCLAFASSSRTRISRNDTYAL